MQNLNVFQSLSVVETILRSRYEFFAGIRSGEKLGRKIQAMIWSSFICLALYGGVMGAAHSPLQAAASFVKLPVLFLVTLVICTPSLHFFNILFGSRQTMSQTIALILTAITTTSMLLLSFAPITFFFLVTTSQYTFYKLLNVAFFAIAGGMGIVFLGQGIRAITETDNPQGASARRLIFILWVILYGFVGSQMAWTLRPFMGMPGHEFILFAQVGGNFYSDVFSSASALLGF